MGQKETEEILRSQVIEVYCGYCLQVWKEALDAARVDFACKLRNHERVFYPSTSREVAPATTGETSVAASVPQPTRKPIDDATQPIDKSSAPTS